MPRVLGPAWLAIFGLLTAGSPSFADPRALSDLASGFFVLNGSASSVNLDFSREVVKNTIALSGAGPLISFCPALACVVSPSPDHQRAAALFAAETRDDGHSEEQNVAIITSVRTGELKAWHPLRRYAVGDNVAFSDGRNAVYRATVAGTSSAGGSGPSGKGDEIVDGSVHWKWINDAAISAKVGLYNELATLRGGGASWGQANNVHMQPGSTPSFNVNTELDFSNDAAECVVGKANCNNLIVAMGGAFKSTTGVYVMSDNATVDASHWGLRLAGRHLASDADVEEDAEAPVGFGIGLFGSRSHSRASIQDQASGPVSYLVSGDHTDATFKDVSNSPASIDIGGKHDVAGLVEHSQSPSGIVLRGHYGSAQISGSGFDIDPVGNIHARSVSTDLAPAVSTRPPASSTAPCHKGQLSIGADFVYACVGENHWRRSALSDF